MCSLLVLNLNTAVNGIFHNGEAVCIALCNVARCHADDVSIYVCSCSWCVRKIFL